MDPLHLLIPLIEISSISILAYYILAFFWNTRGMDLIIGLVSILIIYIFSTWLSLPVLQKLMLYAANIAVIALLIVFQPELRSALSKLSLRTKRYTEITEFDKFLDGITQSIYRLSEKQVGALVLLENQDSLDDFANKAVLLNAQFSSELLESIFAPQTPLHDGAVIIRGTVILSASTILPLADDSTQLAKSMGTRHRAGLGISQLTDALIIVVSEENGKVSIARDGIMTRGIKPDRFKGILRSIFSVPKTPIQTSLDLMEWLKLWKK